MAEKGRDQTADISLQSNGGGIAIGKGAVASGAGGSIRVERRDEGARWSAAVLEELSGLKQAIERSGHNNARRLSERIEALEREVTANGDNIDRTRMKNTIGTVIAAANTISDVVEIAARVLRFL